MKNNRSEGDDKGAAREFPMDSCCAWDGDTLVLNILGKPAANRDAIGKVTGDQLKVSVTASPVAGQATDHMVRFLAEKFGVAVKDIQVVYGRFNVNKQLRIRSPRILPAVISKELEEQGTLFPEDQATPAPRLHASGRR